MTSAAQTAIESPQVRSEIQRLLDLVRDKMQHQTGALHRPAIKRFAIIMQTEDGTAAIGAGCECPICKIAIAMAFAEMMGGRIETVPAEDMPIRPDRRGMN